MKLFEKPPFHTLVQILLDFAGKEEMITAKGISFLNEDNLDLFMNESIANEVSSPQISCSIFLHRLMHSKSHQKIVDKVLLMFENSNGWANEAVKLLSTKETNEIHPLNSKKMKPKK